MKVRVYWNLHKKTFSIMDVATGRVVAHQDQVLLYDPQFVVRPAGNRKVRETGRKNVHAFVVGTWMHGTITRREVDKCALVTYNPYRDTTFVERTEERTPIFAASWAELTGNGQFPTVLAYK